MSYQLNQFDLLKVWLSLDVISYILIYLAINLPFIWIFYKNHLNEKKLYMHILTVFVLIPIFIISFFSFSLAGIGWQLEGDTLYLKLPKSSFTIDDIHQSNFYLVDMTGEWKAVYRINGSGIPGLKTGIYKMKNGEKTILFQYRNYPTGLLIEKSDNLFVISHPSVENLHKCLQNKVKNKNV